eukprot:1159406-Pelagomonas_calceolata.AAC.8
MARKLGQRGKGVSGTRPQGFSTICTDMEVVVQNLKKVASQATSPRESLLHTWFANACPRLLNKSKAESNLVKQTFLRAAWEIRINPLSNGVARVKHRCRGCRQRACVRTRERAHTHTHTHTHTGQAALDAIWITKRWFQRFCQGDR